MRHPLRAVPRPAQAALRVLVFFVLLGGALAATPAWAQTGKIQGVVTAASTGETLPGVNVVIEGTTRGATTNIDGEYVIIGVRPGTYTLRSSFVGFETVLVENVRVQIDLTTEIDIQMREEVFEGEEVVVVAQRPLVQRDLTATTAVVSGDEIRALPVENFSDVIELQAGVVDGHFRGGRLGEVGYWVDGLPVNDAYDGGLGVQLENQLVDEVQVVTGAFNAEYGQAMSGIVNVVTRDGSNEFEGSVSGFAGDYLTGAGDTYQNLGDISPFSVANVEGNFAGPILRDRLWFFVSGRYFENAGHLYGRDVFRRGDVVRDDRGNLILVSDTLGGAVPGVDIPLGGSGDSSYVSMNPYERLTGQAKLTLRLTNNIRVAGNFLYSTEDYADFSQDLLLFPTAQLTKTNDARTSYVKWTHTLTNRTFYEAGITNNYRAFEQYAFEDVLDPRYREPDFFGFRSPSVTSNFAVGGTDNSRFRRSTNTWLVKADVTSQLNDANLVKIGVEFRRHDLAFRDDYVLVFDEEAEDPRRGQTLATGGRYDYQPIEAAAYIQDKVELGDLIINAGLRFDYFAPRAPIFKEEFATDPQAVFIENRLYEETGQGGRQPKACAMGEGDMLDYTSCGFFEDASPKWQLSPRLGVAFPISAGGVIHFSYGWFFQTPSFQLLYQNPRYALGTSGSGLVGLFGNPDLEPEQTISGEIGLKQQVGEGSAIELTAYYRDIRNLTGTALDPIRIAGTSANYARLVNSDFGFVRGFIFRFDQRLTGNVYLGADYTFQVAKANASTPEQVFATRGSGGEPEQQILPTDWDQRHSANLKVSYNQGGRWGVSALATMGTGLPYTPQQTTQQTGDIIPTTIPLNSETRPFRFDMDIDAFYNVTSFRGTDLQVFMNIDNVLDRQNEYGVYNDTGRGTYSLQEIVDQRSFQGDPSLLSLFYNNASFFGEPRRVTLGARYTF